MTAYRAGEAVGVEELAKGVHGCSLDRLGALAANALVGKVEMIEAVRHTLEAEGALAQ